MSATFDNEAMTTVENEATQTDWMGDLIGELGFDSAAGCGVIIGRSIQLI